MIQKLDDGYISSVAKWICSKKSKISNLGFDRVREIVDWAAQYRNIGIVREKGDIVGIGIAKKISDEDDGTDFWKQNEDGKTIYVQCVITEKPAVVSMLWDVMKERFGKQDFVSMKRHGKLRKWAFADYDRKMNILSLKG